jgi:serine/threonine protein kinase
MEILEYSEDFGGPMEDFAFQRTVVVYNYGGSIYRAYSRKRYTEPQDIQFSDLYGTNKIRSALVFPEFQDSFTKAEDPGPHRSSWFLKKPSLSPYTPRYPTLIKETWIEEVKICEILKKHPHPNIAQYHGCAVMEDGTIRGIYFTRYDETLMERINPLRRSKMESTYERRGADQDQVERWVERIKRGIRHLHSLGIVHNDVNPANIMFYDDEPVIIDFDSSRPTGYDLSLVKRTYGWHDERVMEALPSNDLNALEEIKSWLLGDVHQFQF